MYTDSVYERNFKTFWDNLDFEDKKSIVKNVNKKFVKDYRLFFDHVEILDGKEIKDCLEYISKNVLDSESSFLSLLGGYLGLEQYKITQELQKISGDVKEAPYHLVALQRTLERFLQDFSREQRIKKFLMVWKLLSIEDRCIILLHKSWSVGPNFTMHCLGDIDYNTLFNGQSDLVKVYSQCSESISWLIYNNPEAFKDMLKVVQSVGREHQEYFINLFRYNNAGRIVVRNFLYSKRTGGPIFRNDGSLSANAKEIISVLIPILMNDTNYDHKKKEYNYKYTACGVFFWTIFKDSNAGAAESIEFIKLFKDKPLVIKEILSCIKTEYPQHFKALKKDIYLKKWTILSWKDQDFKYASEIISMSGDSEVSGPLHSYLEYKSSGTTKTQPSTDYKAVLCDLMVRLTPNELSMLSSAVGLEESNGVNVNCSFLAKVSQSKIKASLKRKIQKSFARNHDPDVKDVLKKSP